MRTPAGTLPRPSWVLPPTWAHPYGGLVHEAMGIVNQDGAAIDKDLNVNQIEEKGGKRQGRASLIGAAFFTQGVTYPMRGMCADDLILYDSSGEAKQARQRVVGPCLLVISNKENHMTRPVQTLRRRALGALSFAIALVALSGCGGGGGGSDINTLYDAYKALTPGMTKAEVLDLVPFKPSQGASTGQVLWVEGQEALGVRFNGSSSTGVITFAQWGLSIPAGGQNESRNF